MFLVHITPTNLPPQWRARQAMLRLVVGSKRTSTWSLRSWLLLKELNIPFEEVLVPFREDAQEQEAYRTQVKDVLRPGVVGKIAPTGKVPALLDSKAGVAVWDTLAIAEYVAERNPHKAVWPKDQRTRALARAVVAEMHSSFPALRGGLPGNFVNKLPVAGQKALQDKAVQADVDRVVEIWTSCLSEYGGPFLFGKEFTAADAFFAPVAVGRFRAYAVPLPAPAQTYVDTIANLSSCKEWMAAAAKETPVARLEKHKL